MHLILIGKAGSGKDTVADFLSAHYNFKRYAFADKLKEVTQELFPVEWKENKRSTLQNVGSLLRGVRQTVWIDYVIHDALIDDRTVITDCRYSNEYEICVRKGYIPVQVICDAGKRQDRILARDGVEMTVEQFAHPSEQLDVKCSFILDNNGGFEDLYRQIVRMMEEVKSCYFAETTSKH